MMDGRGKSDGPIVPTKSSNNATAVAAERMEGRGSTKGNAVEQNVLRTQSRAGTTSALERVRKAAIRNRKMKFTALFHHVSVDLLRLSFFALRRKASAGVDGVTWEQYREGLEHRLVDLHGRLHRGAYRASPARRVFIPKANGQERPLGIATLEDKIVQGAVVRVLNEVYEVDFLGFSYGFRPGRGQHDALDALSVGILRRKVNWVLDADIRGFFDTIDHGWLRRFLEHRIADGRIVRLILKWLRAGVLHEGAKTVGKMGTPQGATVSPVLANIYLHYVFDLWVEQWRRKHARGEVIVVRYADDIVLGFEREADARRFRSELEQRLRGFGLELHPDKTRLLRFGRFAARDAAVRGEGAPATFSFLGFAYICAKTKRGRFLLVRWTEKTRLRATLRDLRKRLLQQRHLPIPVQGAWLRRVVQGYFNYYAVPTNVRRLGVFRTQLIRAWLHALRRRSQRHRMTWKRMAALAARWLPGPRILHPWPEIRFDAKTRGRSPVR